MTQRAEIRSDEIRSEEAAPLIAAMAAPLQSGIPADMQKLCEAAASAAASQG
jgi:hypothetical protein